MKKILICLAALGLIGCSAIETKSTLAEEAKLKYYRLDSGACVYSIEIEGHIYIAISGSHRGCIIHAEHCPCKMK